MRISIPYYLLDSLLRHYAALARGSIERNDLRAINARRVAAKEIGKIRKLIHMQKTYGKTF